MRRGCQSGQEYEVLSQRVDAVAIPGDGGEIDRLNLQGTMCS